MPPPTGVTGTPAPVPRAVAVFVAGTSPWFTAAAGADELARRFGVPAAGAAWLTGVVSLGFALGAAAAALARLPDRFPPGRLMAVAAVTVAALTAALLAPALGYVGALALRAGAGIALGVLYPTGMRLVCSWVDVRRAGAVALVVGALALGTGLPHLLVATPLPGADAVLLASAAAAGLAAVGAWTLTAGPHVTAAGRGPGAGELVRAMRRRRSLGALAAYVGHMLEQYAAWALAPVLVAVLARRSGAGTVPDARLLGAGAFVVIGLAGVAGALAGGAAGDRWGARRAALAAVTVSGAAAAVIAATLGSAPVWVPAVALVVWGAASIADSPLLSTLQSRAVAPAVVGGALAAQMAVGYALSSLGVVVAGALAAGHGPAVAAAVLVVPSLLAVAGLVATGPDLSPPGPRPAGTPGGTLDPE